MIAKTCLKSASKSHQSHQTLYSASSKPPTMTRVRCLLSVAVASSLLLVGCNDDNNTTTTGYPTLVQPVSRFNAAEIDNQLLLAEKASLGATLTAPATCGVTVEKISYPTQGSAGEATNATAALMLPNGDAADCQGSRPVLLYAHGTDIEKSYDLTQVGNNDNPAAANATLIAANYAAQGYIVIAPNYAGYDSSALDYHPYLDAKQQSAEMVHALDSARLLMNQQHAANNSNYTKIKDSGKLFISGYSQGGHVAMATARLLQQAGKPVTAIAPASGPYALAAFSDAMFAGKVGGGATAFTPLLATAMQRSYGGIYQNPTDAFTANYANTKLPNMLSFSELIMAGKLPQTALFQATQTEQGFGFADKDYLIQSSFRAAYLADAQARPDGLFIANGNGMPANDPQFNIRKALKVNDLRGYVPTMPTLLCGGNQDPTVFYDLNTGSMMALLQGANASITNPAAQLNVTILDVDATNEATRKQPTGIPIGNALKNPWMLTSAITTVQENFANKVGQVSGTAFNAAYKQALANGLSSTEATKAATEAAQVTIASTYHGGLASIACNQATREFFDQEFAKS